MAAINLDTLPKAYGSEIAVVPALILMTIELPGVGGIAVAVGGTRVAVGGTAVAVGGTGVAVGGIAVSPLVESQSPLAAGCRRRRNRGRRWRNGRGRLRQAISKRHIDAAHQIIQLRSRGWGWSA